MDAYLIIAKYYTPGSKLYNTLIIHSESVRDKAIEIALKHPELGADTKFLAEAAMLHDIGIFLTKAPEIHCHGTHNYMQHGHLGAELLRQEGLHLHALACERHIGTGLTKETIIRKGWDIPQVDTMPISIEEQILCYADLFFSKSRLDQEHKISYIRKKLTELGPENIAQFNLWYTMFK